MDELKKILRILSQKPPSVHVKVDDSARYSKHAGDSGAVSTESNSEIGAKHEFGIGVPQRSFLRMPLEEKLPEFLDKTMKEPEELIRKSLSDGTLAPLMDAIAEACEATVQGAFDTGGFGNWTPNAPSTQNSGQILVDTTQLRNAIKAEVK